MRAVSWCKNADSKHFIWNSTSELRRDIGELKYRPSSLEDASLFIIIDWSVTSIFKNSPSRSLRAIFERPIWPWKCSINYVSRDVECTRWIERLIHPVLKKLPFYTKLAQYKEGRSCIPQDICWKPALKPSLLPDHSEFSTVKQYRDS